MKNKSLFQMVVFGLFAFFIVAAVFVFAGLSGRDSAEESVGEVLMWGTVDADLMQNYLQNLAENDKTFSNVDYIQRDPRSFTIDVVDALAAGVGPDIILLDQGDLVQFVDKIQPISYEQISLRDFQSAFVEEGELFLGTSGIFGLPFTLDPLVLYWNRDLLSTAGYAEPPRYWDELFGMATKITKVDEVKGIGVSTIAFGEYQNVTNAKDILSALIMQAGGSIVVRDVQSGALAASLTSGSGTTATPTQTALRFFSEFSNPVKDVYSWNRSLPASRDAFAAGTLALYPGYASELPVLLAKNPHLNFGVAPLPQVRGSASAVTIGNLHALAIPRLAPNLTGGLIVAQALSRAPESERFAQLRGVPSPRRDNLVQIPDDPASAVFRDAALVSKGWLDPHNERTDDLFRRMIESVVSGSSRLSESVERADKELEVLLQ